MNRKKAIITVLLLFLGMIFIASFFVLAVFVTGVVYWILCLCAILYTVCIYFRKVNYNGYK